MCDSGLGGVGEQPQNLNLASLNIDSTSAFSRGRMEREVRDNLALAGNCHRIIDIRLFIHN